MLLPSELLVKLEQAFLGQVCVILKELRACFSRIQ